MIVLSTLGSHGLIQSPKQHNAIFLSQNKKQLSISGGSLVFFLMVSFVAILLWATKGAASPNIQLFAFGSPSSSSQFNDPSLNNDLLSSSIVLDGELLVFSMSNGLQEDVFALSYGTSTPIRLTSSVADDRDPCLSPDNEHLAFSSHRDGNWELYVMSLKTGQVTRLTYNLAYEGNPSFSPDGQWIAFEAYYNNNLDIYVIRADGSEGPYSVTSDLAADHSPSWTPDIEGRELAYLSTKEGLSDIYIISLDDNNDNNARNITNSPSVIESSPEWNTDGSQLLYSINIDGESFIYSVDVDDSLLIHQEIGNGRSPIWTPDGTHYLALRDNEQETIIKRVYPGLSLLSDEIIKVEGVVYSTSIGNAELPVSFEGEIADANLMESVSGLLVEEVTSGRNDAGLYLLFNLPGVEVEAPYLSDLVDGSFSQLRESVHRAAGWDVLGQLSVVWSPIDRPVEPGQSVEDWHKAGRAFSLDSSRAFSDIPDFEMVPRQEGPNLYWDVYVRCSVQDGSLGEPLKSLPWDFESRFSGEDVAAYENGGRWRASIPSGYYINLTRMAARAGWIPAKSDPTWIYNWPGVKFWEFIKPDGLSWREAMLQLYTEEEFASHFGSG